MIFKKQKYLIKTFYLNLIKKNIVDFFLINKIQINRFDSCDHFKSNAFYIFLLFTQESVVYKYLLFDLFDVFLLLISIKNN